MYLPPLVLEIKATIYVSLHFTPKIWQIMPNLSFSLSHFYWFFTSTFKHKPSCKFCEKTDSSSTLYHTVSASLSLWSPSEMIFPWLFYFHTPNEVLKYFTFFLSLSNHFLIEMVTYLWLMQLVLISTFIFCHQTTF